MKIYQSAQALGFFDVELRVQWLEAKGNPLSRLDAVSGWASFGAGPGPTGQGAGRASSHRPAQDVPAPGRAMVVHNLSDAPAEYQVSDRLTLQQFVVSTVADKVPDTNTLGPLGKREPLSRTPS